MRILSHYFVARFLGLFAMVLVVALLLLATVELVLNLEDVSAFANGSSDAGTGLPATLRYLGLRLTTYYLADLLPVASFVAVFVAFAIAGRAMELIAIQAGGVRPFRIVLPVLATALILSLGTAILHETVILRAERLWSGTTAEEDSQIEFGREAFWMHKGPMITNVGSADPETRTLYDVEIFERTRTGSVVRVIRADEVHIREDGLWQIARAQVWRFDAADFARDPEVERDVYLELDLDALRADLLLAANPAHLPLPELARYLESNPAETPTSLRRMRGRYHERLASPWLILVFAWLAVPFGLRVDERGHFVGSAIAAIVTLSLYFVTQSAGQTLAQQELIPVGVTPWATMAAFSLFATGAFFSRAR